MLQEIWAEDIYAKREEFAAKHEKGDIMTMETSPQLRFRCNVQYSVKGVRTTDATVELVGDEYDADKFWALQLDFQRKVDEMYPPPVLVPDKNG